MFKELGHLGLNLCKRKIDIPQHLGHPNDINDFFVNTPNKNFIPNVDLINAYRQVKHINATDSLEFTFTNEKEISDIVFSIKSNTAGLDEISMQLIKYSIAVVAPIMVHIINFVIGHNYFPNT